ncbi:hypothetical protein HK102_013798 [Quaeritorhiza haematococci]|nr:hypothetical protein HK102_013798 [Quaeritorhiza haematococci]
MIPKSVTLTQIQPPLDSYVDRYMLEPILATVTFTAEPDLEAHNRPQAPQENSSESSQPQQAHANNCFLHLEVQAWTNIRCSLNPDANWVPIPCVCYTCSSRSNVTLNGIDVAENNTNTSNHHEYRSKRIRYSLQLQPTAPGDYEMTFRYRSPHDSNPNTWTWCGAPGQNVRVHVRPPPPIGSGSAGYEWAMGPSYKIVYDTLVVSNYIAASKAESLGFHAVLNMADELDLQLAPEIEYLKLGCKDGANNAIPAEVISEAVDWIGRKVRSGKTVCVHCRAGIGRSGSVAIAYVYSRLPQASYDAVKKLVWEKKPDIYPHTGLEETLKQLYPRKM